MRRSDPVRIGDLMKNLVKNNPKLSQMFLESKVIEIWKDIMPPHVLSHTSRITVYRNKITIWLTSAALRHEIFMRRTELIQKINQAVGQDIITAIYVK